MLAGCGLAVIASSELGLLHAQQPVVLTGRVFGVGGVPLHGAEVILGRIATDTTDAAGRFRLEGVPPGEQALLVRLIGYLPSRVSVSVRDMAPEPLAIYLAQSPWTLEDVVVRGERRGVFGVVLDPRLQPFPGATVTLVGGGDSQVTDSVGRFAFPDKTGAAYALRTEAPGYMARLVQLRVPAGQSREVTIHLAHPVAGRLAPRNPDWMYFQLGRRLGWRSRNTRLEDAEIARFAEMRVCDVPKVRASFRGREDDLRIVLDGHQVFWNWSLCDWKVSELAVIELGLMCDDQGVRDLQIGRRGRAEFQGSRDSFPCIGLWRK
jgi:hypothetical protein